MDAAGKLSRERRIYHAMAFDPALSAEGIRHDIDSVVSLAARAVAGLAFVEVRFVLRAQALGGESLAQLFGEHILRAHDPRSYGRAGLARVARSRQPGPRRAHLPPVKSCG